MYYSPFNPNGSYSLDLSNDVQREVAKNIIVKNKEV